MALFGVDILWAGAAGPWCWPGIGWALDDSGAPAFLTFLLFLKLFQLSFHMKTNVFHCYLPISAHAGIGQT